MLDVLREQDNFYAIYLELQVLLGETGLGTLTVTIVCGVGAVGAQALLAHQVPLQLLV